MFGDGAMDYVTLMGFGADPATVSAAAAAGVPPAVAATVIPEVKHEQDGQRNKAVGAAVVGIGLLAFVIFKATR